MADINEAAEKKLKSRMTKIRKCNREPEEKEKFSEKFGVSVEMEFQNIVFIITKNGGGKI